MDIELTVQVKCTRVELENVLKTKGFKLVEQYSMKDSYFSWLKGSSINYYDLVKNSFLVRNIVLTDRTKQVITYKFKSFDAAGNVISEVKTETAVDNTQKAIEVFKLAGLNEWIIVEQKMSVYSNGSIEFIVEDVKDLGLFIEYEIQNLKAGTDKEKMYKQMIAELKALQLPLGDDYSCKKAYMMFEKTKA